VGPFLLIIDKAVLDEVVVCCRRTYPNEACGVLTGIRRSDGLYIEEYYKLANISARPEYYFHIDPREWTEAWYHTNKKGRKVVGIFHSHAHTPAVPSPSDLQTMWHMLPSYWIVSLMDYELPTIRAFKLSRGDFAELAYELNQPL
jgi:proteasome lid subunit RPN8/RPN11